MSMRQRITRIQDRVPENKCPRRNATTNRSNARTTQSSCMKRLVMLAACVVLSGTSLFGQTNALKFDSLPSAQGWSLLNSCASPESSLFSVANNVLHQNTIGCGQTAAYYTLNNVVTRAAFSLTVTARVTSDEVFNGNGNLGHLGVSFGAEGSNKEYYIGLGPGFIDAVIGPGITGTVLSASIYTTKYHI